MKRAGYQAWQMVVLILLAAAMVVSLVVPESLLTPPAPRRVEISILMRQPGTPAGSSLRQGMEQAAQDLNAELRFLALEAEDPGEEQLELLRSQAEIEVDAAVVLPADCQALGEMLTHWHQLPVITLESPVTRAQGFVGPDDESIGRQLAQQIARDFQPGDRVLLVESNLNWGGPVQRMESARAALEQAGFAPEQCSQLDSQTWAGAQAVVCFDPDTLEQAAALAALEQDPPRIYGAGVTDKVVAQLETGGIAAIAAWSDYAVGYLAVTQAAAAARGQKPENNILPVTLVQEGETYEKDYEKLLYPTFH